MWLFCANILKTCEPHFLSLSIKYLVTVNHKKFLLPYKIQKSYINKSLNDKILLKKYHMEKDESFSISGYM